MTTLTISEKMVFKNNGDAGDKEWAAHINLLNEWTDRSRILRQIIQYARSGPFYPADMHVDLIKQWAADFAEHITPELTTDWVEILPNNDERHRNKWFRMGYNACRDEITKRTKEALK